MNKYLIGLVVVVVLGVVGFYAFWTAPAASKSVYESATYGLKFNYPEYYQLTEREVSNAERGHYNVVLTDSREPEPPVGGEGGAAITVDIYQNNLDQLSAEQWINNSTESNFKLSPDGRLESFVFDGFPAASYSWDGLYRGETVVVGTPKFIYAFSVTTLTPQDQIRRDFYRLLETVDIAD